MRWGELGGLVWIGVGVATNGWMMEVDGVEVRDRWVCHCRVGGGMETLLCPALVLSPFVRLVDLFGCMECVTTELSRSLGDTRGRSINNDSGIRIRIDRSW